MSAAYVSFVETHLRRMSAALGISVADLKLPIPAREEAVEIPALFVVWIDLNFGGEFGPPEWIENSEPQPLADALAEAREARLAYLTGGSPWVCKVEPA